MPLPYEPVMDVSLQKLWLEFWDSLPKDDVLVDVYEDMQRAWYNGYIIGGASAGSY